jgi:hypothetical protein
MSTQPPFPDPDPGALNASDQGQALPLTGWSQFPVPPRGSFEHAEAVFAAWAAADLAAKAAALIERRSGADSSEAIDARSRASRLEEALLAILQAPRGDE